MAVATKIQLPYQEDTGLDGKKSYTPKEWTERLRHYTKRIYNIDIKPILTDDTVPTGDPWNTKKPDIRQDFIWGAGPSAIEIITKGESHTDPDTITTDKLIQLFKEYYMPKRNTCHSRGDFFWAKQEENETPEEHWKKLITLEKNCELKDIKQEDILISKFITSRTDKKLSGETYPREDPKPENHRRAYHTKQLRPPTQTIYHTSCTCKRQRIQRRTNPKKNNQNSKPINTATEQHKRKTTADFVDNKIGTLNIHARQKTRNATTARKWATSHEYAGVNKTETTKEESIIWKKQVQKKKKKVNPKISAK